MNVYERYFPFYKLFLMALLGVLSLFQLCNVLQYGFIAWLLSTCVGLLFSFLRYGPYVSIDHCIFSRSFYCADTFFVERISFEVLT